MSAFLFLPSTGNGRHACRVDLANIGALFGDGDEPVAARRAGMSLSQALLAMLIVLFTVGDIVLVARPDALAAGLRTPIVGQATT